MLPKINLLALDRAKMESMLATIGEKPFRAKQILQWIYQHGTTDFAEMTNLSISFRKYLSEKTHIKMPALGTVKISTDGTQKWLLPISEKNAVETAYIPTEKRDTLCVSSQVGCPLNCDFCATAKQGFNRHLTSDEIIAQIWLVNHTLGRFKKDKRIISNIVYMGMGEPLLNYEQVITTINLLTDDYAFGLSAKHITVSTAGIVPKIRRLAKEQKVGLAVSLHATSNLLRDKLVPLNRQYPIETVLAACKDYATYQPNASITIEYVMLAGVNDSLQEARKLVKLLAGLPVKINLIPFNHFPNTTYRCTDPAQIDAFRQILLAAGLVAITRKTRGDDIAAACGQLAGKVVTKKKIGAAKILSTI